MRRSGQDRPRVRTYINEHVAIWPMLRAFAGAGDVRTAHRSRRGTQARLLADERGPHSRGYIGLMRAAKRFDPDRGIRFSTYARWWVRAQMTRALETTGRMVRLPGGAVEQIRNLQKAAERLDRLGEDWTVDDLAAEVGIETPRAQLLLRQGGVISLDQPDDDGFAGGDRISASGKDINPDENAIKLQALELVKDKFGELLDDRERYILLNHYGLEGRDARPWLLASRWGCRANVRQIEVGALQRLRHHLTLRLDARAPASPGASSFIHTGISPSPPITGVLKNAPLFARSSENPTSAASLTPLRASLYTDP